MSSSVDRNQIWPASSRCCWTVEPEGNGTIRLLFEGDWKLDQTLPKPSEILASDPAEGLLRKVRFDSRSLAGWDSCLLVFLRDLDRIAGQRRIEIDRAGLPEGVRKLLDLSAAVPECKGARRSVERDPFLARVGATALALGQGTVQVFTFIGECTVALVKLCSGRARLQRSDLLVFIEDCGVARFPLSPSSACFSD